MPRTKLQNPEKTELCIREFRTVPQKLQNTNMNYKNLQKYCFFFKNNVFKHLDLVNKSSSAFLPLRLDCSGRRPLGRNFPAPTFGWCGRALTKLTSSICSRKSDSVRFSSSQAKQTFSLFGNLRVRRTLRSSIPLSRPRASD